MNIEPPCILTLNPTWSERMTLLMYSWIWFSNSLLSIFASCSPAMFACNFLVCVCVCVCVCGGGGGGGGILWFWYQGNCGKYNDFESVFSCLTFQKSLRSIGVNFSKCLVEYNCKAIMSDPGLFFIRSFVITGSVSLAVIGLFVFSISFWFSLES